MCYKEEKYHFQGNFLYVPARIKFKKGPADCYYALCAFFSKA